MPKGAQSAIIHEAWTTLLNRKYEVETELYELEAALDALRPVVEGGTPNGPCAGLTARDAAMVVLKERPDTIWSNNEILDRMRELDWETTAKTPGGVSGTVATALKQLSEQELVVNVARGQWQITPDPAPIISQEAMGLQPRSPVGSPPGDNKD